MATMADIPYYDNMIGALSTFAQQITEASSQMASAGRAVVSGTNDDESAAKASAKIQSLLPQIGEICGRARRVMSALENEKQEIIEASRIMNDV